MTMLIMLVIICTTVNLFLIYLYARNLKNYTESTQKIKNVEIQKGIWVTNIVEAVTKGSSFKGELDSGKMCFCQMV
ncbi:MAG: hypothetical protein HFH65_04345 [Lachnospiraceae bacterium]|nr:hypothetical protein [Lachnospiraceae bacterium]